MRDKKEIEQLARKAIAAGKTMGSFLRELPNLRKLSKSELQTFSKAYAEVREKKHITVADAERIVRREFKKLSKHWITFPKPHPVHHDLTSGEPYGVKHTVSGGLPSLGKKR